MAKLGIGDFEITGYVTEVKHTGVSSMGNPRLLVTIRDKDGNETPWRTSDNIMLAYGIENPEYREKAHIFGLTRAGRLNGRCVCVEEDVAEHD